METLGGWLARYLAHLRARRLSPGTVAEYQRELSQLVTWLAAHGAVTPEAISTELLREFLARNPDLATSTLIRRQSVIRTLLSWLVTEGALGVNPADRLAHIKRRRPEPRWLTIEQVGQLLAAAGGESFTKARNHALLSWLYSTGCRISEVLKMTFEQLDLPNRRARIVGKGRKYRWVFLTEPAAESLKRWLSCRAEIFGAPGAAGQELVFVTTPGRQIGKSQLNETVKRIASRAGLPRWVSPHKLRHSYATHLHEGGASLIRLRDLMGHESVETTQIYTHACPSRQHAAFLAAHPQAQT